MAYKNSPPERYPYRPPPGVPGRPPRVHWEDTPAYADSPPRGYASLPPAGGSPPYRLDEGHRRFAGESPQRYLEPPPPGYHESPPRRFPGRRNPAYLSPEDSPPYRYSEDAPRRYVGARRPYAEEDRLPIDIDGPPPAGFINEPPRRFGGGPPGYRSERARRFPGSESPSPPPGYYDGPPPRPPPPPGDWIDEPPRRFSGAPRPGYADEQPRRFFETPPRLFSDTSPPPRYADEGPRRFEGTPPRRPGEGDPVQFYEGAPPGLPGPQRYADPAGLPGPAARYTDGASPARYADGAPPARYADPAGLPGPPARYGDSAPPGQSRDGSPPGLVGAPGRYADAPPRGRLPGGFPPGYLEEPPRRFEATPPRRPDVPPPLEHPAFPPDIFTSGVAPPPFRQSPDVYAAGGRPGAESAGSSPPLARYGERYARTPEESSPEGRFEAAPYATPPREGYRPPPPGLGTGGPLLGGPLLGVPPDYAAPQRPPTRTRGGGVSPPEFLFACAPRRHLDGYKATTPPRQPPPRPSGLANDAIFTADVVPIELDDKLKELQPHPGNPGSSTGGGWKDMWAGILFVVHIAGMTLWSVLLGLKGLKSTIDNYGNPSSYRITNWFPPLAAAAIVGAVFSFFWQTLIRRAPVLMILVTAWTGAAVMSIFGIVLIATGKTTGLIGLAFLFAGLCQALYAFVVRDRVPFAGEVLKKVISVCSANPTTYGVSYVFVLLALGWLALWIFGLSGSAVQPRHAAIMVGFVASLLWTLQVMRNIIRVTVAGTVSAYYFQEKNMPPMAAYVSLFRACTLSLGSICFGSFFVPLVEAPCHGLRRINAQAGASEFMFSCVVCLLGCFEHLIRYFNRMGYIQVAVYGKPFLRASKDTWDMLRAQDVDVLVHDDLTISILLFACGIGGSLSAIIGGLWTFIAHKSLTVSISMISFVIGFLITYLTMSVVESAVATYYVSFAEDPATLQRHDGPFYERMWVRQMELKTPVTELTA